MSTKQLVPLKSIADINRSTLSEKTDPDTSIRYIDIGSVSKSGFNGEHQDFTFETAPSRARRKLKDGSTIIATVRTYLKAVAFFDKPAKEEIVSTGFAVLDPKNNINQRYLYYRVAADDFVQEVEANSVGVSYPAINPSDLGKLKLSISGTRDKQGKIANYLDTKTQTLDKILTAKTHTHTHLSELRQAIIDTAILELGMSDLLALKRVAAMINRGASPDYADDGESKFINQACIYREGIKFSAAKSANKLSHPTGSRGYLRRGDALVNSTGTGTLGRVAIFNQENDGVYFADSHVTIVRPNSKKIDPQYLRYVMLSTKFQDEVYTMCVSGSTNQIELSREHFRELQIPVPSLEEQRKIVRELEEKIDKVDEADIILQKSISQLEEYRSSLISNVVGGKVEV